MNWLSFSIGVVAGVALTVICYIALALYFLASEPEWTDHGRM